MVVSKHFWLTQMHLVFAAGRCGQAQPHAGGVEAGVRGRSSRASSVRHARGRVATGGRRVPALEVHLLRLQRKRLLLVLSISEFAVWVQLHQLVLLVLVRRTQQTSYEGGDSTPKLRPN